MEKWLWGFSDASMQKVFWLIGFWKTLPDRYSYKLLPLLRLGSLKYDSLAISNVDLRKVSQFRRFQVFCCLFIQWSLLPCVHHCPGLNLPCPGISNFCSFQLTKNCILFLFCFLGWMRFFKAERVFDRYSTMFISFIEFHHKCSL